ncbi:NRDE family protein [Hydrogenophaga crassostreae]|nr:NRDE family protein [Hydrogenophaga crassostreae]
MCLIAFAIDVEAGVPLLIAGNRDEFFERPTAPLHRWALPNGVEVVGGRDLRDGGTWLGLNTQGRLAMLTNVRSAQMGPAARSRGELASRWLAGDLSWEQLLDSISPADYGGFNLVVGDARLGFWGWVSNRNPADPHGEAPPDLFSRQLPSGLYGLSNATLDTGWPKALHLKDALAAAMPSPFNERNQAQLLQALGNSQLVDGGQLPATGVPQDWERSLSSPFVNIPERGYGTRSSLLVRVLQQPDQAASGLGWQLSLDEWTHGNAPEDRAVWREDQRRTERLSW